MTDPVGPSNSGYQTVTRGGNWNSEAKELRSAARNFISTTSRKHNIKFRLVRVPTNPNSFNPGPLSAATNFNSLIDANLPTFDAVTFTPSNTAGFPTTLGLGSILTWDLPFLNSVDLANGDDQLSVVGNFLSTTFVFNFIGGSNLYRGSYTVSDSSTPSPSITYEQIEIVVSDSAGNTVTTSTTNMGVIIDVVRPQLSSLSVTSENTAITTIGILDRLRISATVSESSTSGGTDPIQSIVGSLNGESLIFTEPTTTAPFTWEAFYTIQENNDPSSNGTVLVTEVYAYDIVGNPSLMATTSLSITIDVTRPNIDLVSISSVPTTDRLKVGEIIEFEVPSGSFTSDIHSITGTFNSSSFEFVLTGTTKSWKATYAIIEGYPDQTDSSDYPELILDASDEAGNSLSSSFTSDVIYLFDANTPFISSLSHNGTVAGTLYTHHAYATDDTSIEFTFNLTTPDLGISIEAYYNETSGGPIPLIFNPNSDGSQYVATYYVRADHNSQATAKI